MGAPATALRRRIVVADDSAFMRRVLVDALTAEGFDVMAEAKNGDEAVDACGRHQPDALTLELAADSTRGARWMSVTPARPAPVARPRTSPAGKRFVVIASSTGGPRALG